MHPYEKDVETWSEYATSASPCNGWHPKSEFPKRWMDLTKSSLHWDLHCRLSLQSNLQLLSTSGNVVQYRWCLLSYRGLGSWCQLCSLGWFWQVLALCWIIVNTRDSKAKLVAVCYAKLIELEVQRLNLVSAVLVACSGHCLVWYQHENIRTRAATDIGPSDAVLRIPESKSLLSETLV